MMPFICCSMRGRLGRPLGRVGVAQGGGAGERAGPGAIRTRRATEGRTMIASGADFGTASGGGEGCFHSEDNRAHEVWGACGGSFAPTRGSRSVAGWTVLALRQGAPGCGTRLAGLRQGWRRSVPWLGVRSCGSPGRTAFLPSHPLGQRGFHTPAPPWGIWAKMKRQGGSGRQAERAFDA
jgi:hypothetical protein